MPVPVEYVPARQDRQVLELLEARTVEYVPDTHETQETEAVRPVPVLYLPVWQLSQFTPDQPVGGCNWTPVGKFCQVLFQPASPT